MPENPNSKQYDLEDRTFEFARKVIEFVNKVPKTLTNTETSKQLTRAAGSVGANYIEADESLSRKDFAMRIMICKKEAKEARNWLKLVKCNGNLDKPRAELIS